MKKLLCILFLFGAFLTVQAQDEEEEEEQPEGWSTEGNISLMFNQSSFNEDWTGGGTSNMAGNFLFNYNFNYLLEDVTWDNKLIVDYGITRQKRDEYARKTSDRLEFNSVAGKQLQESNFFYSLFLNFRTQVAKGYRYSEDPETGETLRTEYTNFLSPAYLQFGPGMLWKKSEDLYVNISPATGRLILVDSEITSRPGYEDGEFFGVDQGKATRLELGASLSTYAKFDIIRNVRMENLLNLYSNYRQEPENIDIDYTLNLNMKINDFLSTSFVFQAIYDDNAVRGFQIREVLGVGFSYEF